MFVYCRGLGASRGGGFAKEAKKTSYRMRVASDNSELIDFCGERENRDWGNTEAEIIPMATSSSQTSTYIDWNNAP